MAKLEPQELDFVDRAAVQAEATVEVQATPEEVWAVLVDTERWPRWFAGVRSCRPTSRTGGVGSTREVVLRGGARFQERFIAWEEGRLWAFTGTEMRPGAFAALVERCTIEPLDGGRCRVTYRMAAEPRRGLRRAVPLLRRAFSQGIARGMAGLARELERRRTAAPSDHG